jgi:hypothetical protein
MLAKISICVVSLLPLLLRTEEPTIFYRSEKVVVFSDSRIPDHFRLTATGADTLDAIVLFTIINGNGVEIYRDSLTSVSFCGTGVDTDFPDDPSVLPTARRQRMMDGLKRFFAESNFTRPAVRAGSEVDGNCVDSLAWVEFSKDPTVTAFGYYRFLDLHIGIAYSKSRGRVVPFTEDP